MNITKLYKFRPLSDCVSFERVAEILETGKFWCSPLWDQNDPMEAVYIDLRKSESGKNLPDLFDEKNKYRICSFSGETALENPLMWGYYANGFRGVAIEIDAPEASDDNQVKVHLKVEYADELLKIQHNGDGIRKVLTTKLRAWEHEAEYRFLLEGDTGPRELGKITAVYFGSPYEFVVNLKQVTTASAAIREYNTRKQRLQEISRKMGYRVCSAYATGCGGVSIKEIQ